MSFWSTRQRRRGNRRASGGRRAHRLRVVARTRQATRAFRLKVLTNFCKLLILGALVFGVYVGVAKIGQRLFVENEEYRLRGVDFATDGTLERDRVLELANIPEDAKLFAIDLQEIRDRIRTLPQVQRVEIRRDFGEKTLGIEVTERRPVAWLVTGEGDPQISADAYLLDHQAVPMRALQMLPDYAHLPVIFGIDPAAVREGVPVENPVLAAALEAIRLVAAGALRSPFEIRSIDVSKSYRMIVTDSRHSPFTMGLEKLDRQLERLDALLAYCGEKNADIQYANLMLERNLPVVFSTPPPSPTPAPKATPAPSRAAKSAPRPTPVPGRSVPPVPVRRALPVD